MKTLVIGYGSTLRRDDGVGALIAERLMDDPSLLRQRGSDRSITIEVIARQQLTPDLAEEVSQADLVLFIDACADAAPGEVQVRDVTCAGENWGAFAHEMSPEVLLDCVKDLYGPPPRARLITIGGEDFAIGEGLSAAVEAAIPKALVLARQTIAGH